MNTERNKGDHNLANFSMRGYRIAGKAGELLRAGSNTFGSPWCSVCSVYSINPISSQLMSLNNLPWQPKLAPCTSWLCGIGQSKKPSRFGAFTHSELHFHRFHLLPWRWVWIFSWKWISTCFPGTAGILFNRMSPIFWDLYARELYILN